MKAYKNFIIAETNEKEREELGKDNYELFLKDEWMMGEGYRYSERGCGSLEECKEFCEGGIKMSKKWYQIDKKNEKGELINYEMVKANNRMNALREYLGNDIIIKEGINIEVIEGEYIAYETIQDRKQVLNARIPNDKSFYFEVKTVNQ